MPQLRFINIDRERTEDCRPLTVSGHVSDESFTFLGVILRCICFAASSFARFGSNFNDLILVYKQMFVSAGYNPKLGKAFSNFYQMHSELFSFNVNTMLD